MAYDFACGWACRISTGTGFGGIAHWQAATGSPSIDTSGSFFTNGTTCLVIDTTGGAATTFATRTIAKRTMSGRVYFRLATTPNTGGGIFRFTNAQGSITFTWLTNDHIEAVVGAGATRDSGVITKNVEHYLDFKVDTSGATATLDWKIDGVAMTQATNVQTAADMTAIRCGFQSAITGKMYFAHLVTTDALTEYPIGTGKVLGFLPVSNGTHSFTEGTPDDFQDEASADLTLAETTSWQKIDDLPPSSTFHVKQVVIRSTGYVEYKYATGPGQVPRAVQQVIVAHNVSTQANTQKAVLYDGTTASDAYAATSTGTSAGTLVNASKCWTAAPSGAWTSALFDLLKLRWGYSTDITNNPALDFSILEAEFPLAANVTGTGASATEIAVHLAAVALRMKATGASQTEIAVHLAAEALRFVAPGASATEIAAHTAAAALRFKGTSAPTTELIAAATTGAMRYLGTSVSAAEIAAHVAAAKLRFVM